MFSNRLIIGFLVMLFLVPSAFAYQETDSAGYSLLANPFNFSEDSSGSLVLNMPELTGWPITDESEVDRFASSTAICSDFDGDGETNELITASRDVEREGSFIIHCFTMDGQDLNGWPVTINTSDRFHRDPCSPAVGDIDNDGSLDLVINIFNQLWAFENDGNVKPGNWPYEVSEDWQIFTPSLGDLNNDGYLEIAVTVTNVGTVVLDYLGSPLERFNPAGGLYLGGGISCFADVDGDGNTDLVTGSAWFNNEGQLQAEYRHWPAQRNAILYSVNVACADLDGDNILEIIVPYFSFDTGYHYLNAFDSDGQRLWYHQIYAGLGPWPGAAISDLNADGTPEIIWTPPSECGTVNARIYAFKNDGTDYFSTNPINMGICATSFSNPTCGLFSEEGSKDIVINWLLVNSDPPGLDGLVTVFNSSGEELEEFRTIVEYPIMTSPTLCDLDLDSQRYINVFAGEGILWAAGQEAWYDVFEPETQPFNPRYIDWATLSKNRHRNGVYEQPVGGTLSQDAWWYGTYKVYSDVIVPAGVTLTIQAGSIIRFDNDRALYIEPGGFLVVEGERLDSVYFISSDLNPVPGVWAGIILEEDADLEMSHCMVEYPKYGVSAGLGSRSTIANCTFENCSSSGFYADRPGSASITHSAFKNCGDYGAFYYGGGSVFDYNTVSGCKYGFKYLGGGTINIRHNVITALGMGSPSYWGIYVGPRVINDAPIPVLTADSVTYFGQGGIYIEGAVGGSLNQFIRSKHNTNYGLFMKNTSASTTVYGTDDAHHNTFSYSTYGIYCDKYCYSDFRWNKVVMNPFGIYVQTNANPTFGTADLNSGHNRIETSAPFTGYDMRNDNTYTVLARRNWWGTDGTQLFGPIDASSPLISNPMPGNLERPGAPVETALPVELTVGCYPNPFNANAEIRFSLPEQTDVSIAIYDISGRLIKELAKCAYTAGEHAITWDGTNASGEKVTSGVYFYLLSTPTDERAAGKMVMLK